MRWLLVVIAACASHDAPPAPPPAPPPVTPSPPKCIDANIYQRNYPPKLVAPAQVDVYCDAQLLAKNVKLCTSNYNGSEQKFIEVTLAIAQPTCKGELRLVVP